jgi:hypothetical protein
MLTDFFYDMLVTPANIGRRHLPHLVAFMGLLRKLLTILGLTELRKQSIDHFVQFVTTARATARAAAR